MLSNYSFIKKAPSLLILIGLLIFGFSNLCFAEQKIVKTTGSCAIVGMTPDQASYLAKQRARSAAIEKAAGVSVSSSTLVTNGKVAANFIKSFSYGFIIAEKVKWLPISQHQVADNPPIPVYGVELTSTVITNPKKTHLGLKAKLNKSVFKYGEKSFITVSSRKRAEVAIFNITADNKVIMLFPQDYDSKNVISQSATLLFPRPESGMELTMVTMDGHKHDAEGFMIAAMHTNEQISWLDCFIPNEQYDFCSFFKKYSKVAHLSEDKVLPYEVYF